MSLVIAAQKLYCKAGIERLRVFLRLWKTREPLTWGEASRNVDSMDDCHPA
jgi:hypothetical protein